MSDDEINIAIATKVMGWTTVRVQKNFWTVESHLIPPGCEQTPHTVCRYSQDGVTVMPILDGGFPNYSTSISDAWRLLERLKASMFVAVYASRSGFEVSIIVSNDKVVVQDADTAPMAICRAALAALDGEDV